MEPTTYNDLQSRTRKRGTRLRSWVVPLCLAFCFAADAASAAVMERPDRPQTVKETPRQQAVEAQKANPCGRAVYHEQHDKWLSTSHGASLSYRLVAKVELDKANIAASHGNDNACWHRLAMAEDLDAP